MHTNPLVLPELYLFYSLEGETMSLDRTELGTLPVETIISLLIVGNLQNANKNLVNV